MRFRDRDPGSGPGEASSPDPSSASRKCPRCGSARTKRHGRSGRAQRHYCKGCLRTFSETTGSLLGRLHHKGAFLQFAASFNDAAPVRTDARRLLVSPATVWRWRHRLLAHRLERDRNPPRKLCGPIVVAFRRLGPFRTTWSWKPDFLYHERHPEPPWTSATRPAFTIAFTVEVGENGASGRWRSRSFTYEGEINIRALGRAVVPYVRPGAAIMTHWRRIGVSVPRIDPKIGSSDPTSSTAAGMPTDPSLKQATEQTASIVWTEWDDRYTPLYDRHPARMIQSWFTRWMIRFHGVRAEYLKRYVAWFDGLVNRDVDWLNA